MREKIVQKLYKNDCINIISQNKKEEKSRKHY